MRPPSVSWSCQGRAPQVANSSRQRCRTHIFQTNTQASPHLKGRLVLSYMGIVSPPSDIGVGAYVPGGPARPDARVALWRPNAERCDLRAGRSSKSTHCAPPVPRADRFPRDTAALHRDGINGWRRARRESLTEPSTPAVACPVWAAFVAMSIVAPSSLTLAGVGLALMASCISPVGISLQKLSHSRHAAGRADTAVAADLLQRSAHSTRYYRQGLWLVGMGLVAAASLLDFLGLFQCSWGAPLERG